MLRQNNSFLNELSTKLAHAGFDLCSLLPLSVLPEASIAALPEALRHDSAVLLVANSGPRFWQQLTEFYGGTAPDPVLAANSTKVCEEHPVDAFSATRVAQIVAGEYPHTRFAVLFPDSGQLGQQLPQNITEKTDEPSAVKQSAPVPLQRLGRLAGWHNDSPLGIGLHPEKGLWFAYRAVLVVAGLGAAQLPSARPQSSKAELWDMCRTCSGRPCLPACPASALAFQRAPDMQQCSDYRLSDKSSCAARCLAREACPVGQAGKPAVDNVDEIEHKDGLNSSSDNELVNRPESGPLNSLVNSSVDSSGNGIGGSREQHEQLDRRPLNIENTQYADEQIAYHYLYSLLKM